MDGISCSGTSGKTLGSDPPQHLSALQSFLSTFNAALRMALAKDQPARSLFTTLLAPAGFLCWASEGVRDKT